MRRLLVMLIVFTLVGTLGLPAFAQDDQTIVEIAAGDDRFETLVTAVEAAGLVETLSGEGPFTVFAPTDEAFEALPEGTLDSLLADTEALTQVLTYHVVAGEVLAEDVVNLESATTVQGEDISIRVDEDGNVILNESVMVIITDIQASNGVIHVIDGVILPPSMAAAEEETAHVQIAHFSPDTPAVDIYVNGELSDVQGLEYPNVTDWIELPAGTYEIAVAPAGTSIDDAAIGPAELTFEADGWYNIAAHGSLEAGTLAPAIYSTNFDDLSEENARVALFHAIEDAPAVDVSLADGTVLVSALGYPGTVGDGFFTLDVPAGAYDLLVTPNGDPDTVLFDLSGTELAANTYYFVAAVGTLDGEDEADPQIVLESADLSVMEDMGEMDEDMDDAAEMGTIVDVATEAGQFSTLLTAVEAAGLVDTLNGEGPFTVFAPTDEAFAALPDGTLDSVLADTELLTSILLYHVAEGEVFAEDVVELNSVTTAQGSDISISVDEDGNVILNDSVMVVMTDIQASNGVIHVIDGVLLPSE